MLDSSFLEVSLGSMLALQLFLVWSVHFVYFRRSRSRYINFRDKAQVLSRLLADQEHPQIYFRLLLLSCTMAGLFFRSLAAEPGSVYFRQVSLEEAPLAMLSLAYLSAGLLAFALSASSGQRRSGGVGQDFFTSVWTLACLSPLAFLANNLVCFFLALEALSASSMYMLISSRGGLASSKSRPQGARQAASAVFFHFWSSFFSSVLIVYSIVSFLVAFGTTEWVFLDLLLSLSSSLGCGPSSLQTSLAAYSLVLAVLVKLGASPFFFFKLEVYKGLPLLPLVFYSVLYFFVFNAVFFFLLAYSLPGLLCIVSPGLALVLGLSILYLGSAMFGLPLLRSFFALSSVIGGSLVVFLLLCFFF